MYKDFQMEQDALVKYSGSDKDVVIPTGVKTVGTGAFAKRRRSRLWSSRKGWR